MKLSKHFEKGAWDILAASKVYQVPKITLRRYTKNAALSPTKSMNIPLGRTPPLPNVLEKELLIVALK